VPGKQAAAVFDSSDTFEPALGEVAHH
jgi:hypothetical protein